jgi:succinate-semialdehyde dehydrogenase/glutarate-semialdehyde dehydrogenase
LGRFFEPTIIANVDMGMRIMMEQTFGPIVGISAVDSPGEAAKVMNSQKFGLESYIFSSDNTTITQLCKSLNVGTVHVNDLPLLYDDFLPVSGRKINSKMLKGSSKHIFRKYSNFKAVNIHYM